MPDSRRVTTIERRLGFKWKLGISRSKAESCKIRIIKALSDDIDDAKHKWVHIAPKELRNHSGFEQHCLTLYDKHAHRIWPPPPTDRSAWLVDADFNDWDGEYPRNLSTDQHDDLLRDLFISLVFEKCVRYHENQKQEERRRFKLSINPDTSELFSPAPETALEGSTNLPHQNERSAVISSSNASSQGTYGCDAATSSGQHEAFRGLGAPVARMTPHTSGSVRRDRSHSGKRMVVLDDSDEEDMFGSPSEPANGTSLFGSSAVEQQRHHVEKNNYPENSATPGRKRPAQNYFEDGSPAKKSPRNGSVRVKVRHLSSDSSSRTRLLASFELMPKTLATIFQSAPRDRNAFCRSTEPQNDHSSTNLTKETSKPSNELHSRARAEASTATGRLRLKLSAPTTPSSDSGRKAPPPPQSVAPSDIDSTIHASNPSKSENGKGTLFSQKGSRRRPNPMQNDRAGGRLVSLTSPEKRLPATAKASSQVASRAMPTPSESESSLGSAVGDSRAIYDFVASPDGSRETTPHAGCKQARPYPTRSEPTVTSTTGILKADSIATSQTTSSLPNQCDKTSSTRHLTTQSASDGSAVSESGREHAMRTDKIVDATSRRDSLQSSKVNTSITRHAYVEEVSEAKDSSELKVRNQVDAVAKRTSPPHSSPDNRANSRNVESQTLSLTNEQSALMAEAIAEGLHPRRCSPTAEIRSSKVQPNKHAVSSMTSQQAVPSSLASTQNPADKVAELQTKMGEDRQLADQTLDLLAEPKAKMKEPADSSQSSPTNLKGEQSTSTEAQRSKFAIEGPTPKKLFLQLSTSEANVQQFVVVSFEFSVEELFEKVQKRMNERLDNQAIRFLQLRLPTQTTSEDPYRIQKDDPDTWEWFLEMAREVDGSKLKVLADVEL